MRVLLIPIRRLPEQHLQSSFDFSLGKRPGDLFRKASVLVEKERGHPIHPELRRGRVVHIRVQLYESYPAGIGNSQFIQNRRQPLAVASPRGVKLQQHRASKTKNLAPEHGIGDLEGAVGIKI
jgi:hypothetical protein